MTAPIGYEPDHIRSLAGRTVEAIEALRRIRSTDAEAATAVHAVRVARRTLEDVWMPLLAEIERSPAMVEWRRSQLAPLRAEWGATARWLDASPYREMSGDTLVDELARLDETVPLVRDEESRAEYERWLDERHELAAELARRVSADERFGAELVTAAYDTPTIGLLVGLAEFPASFRLELLSATLEHPWWEEGWEMDKHAAAADTLLASLIDDPARCLQVLGHGDGARTLAEWHPLDQDLVAGFVTAALSAGGPFEGEALRERYEVLRHFVVLANGTPFDGDGFQPGAATGIAASIGGYLPTFVGSLENEHATVQAKSLGIDSEYDFTLGSREVLVDLFGALTRAPAAQDHLGRTLDVAVRDSLGDAPSLRVGDVAEFAELLDLAVTNENDELRIAASARRTSLLRLGTAVALGVAVGTAIHGVRAAQRSTAEGVTEAAFDETVRTVRADTVGRSPLRAITYQSIQLEACRRFARSAHERPRRTIEARIAELESLIDDPGADPADRDRSMLNLIESVRGAGGGPYLDGILEENSVDDLNESGNDADL